VLTALSKSMESRKHKGYDARHQIQIRVPVIGIALHSKLDVGSRAVVRKDKEIGACDVNFTL